MVPDGISVENHLPVSNLGYECHVTNYPMEAEKVFELGFNIL